MTPSGWYVRDRGKVAGPFSQQQLLVLVERGQFRRFHEVSQDRRTWQPATAVPGLFRENLPVARTESAAPPSALDVELVAAPPVEVERWYYADKTKRQFGPVSRDRLIALADGGEVRPSTLVWKDGTPDWMPLSAARAKGLLPARARSHRKKSRGVRSPIIVFAIILVVLLTAGGIAAFFSRDRIVRYLGRQHQSYPVAITGLADERALANSVGLVVCGMHTTHPDGKRVDLKLATGSCFMVSADGYLLTNKHVVEETWDWKHARLMLDKFRTEHLLEVEPTVWVFFQREKYAAEIVYVSDHYDLGILKVDRHGPFFELATDDDLPRGQKVVACGFPGNAQHPHSEKEVWEMVRREKNATRIDDQFKASDFEFTMTTGTVNRVVAEQEGCRWIEHNSLINPGSSGGPLLGDDGVALGINSLASRGFGGTIFSALALRQLRAEIGKHVPGAVWK